MTFFYWRSLSENLVGRLIQQFSQKKTITAEDKWFKIQSIKSLGTTQDQLPLWKSEIF